jgi:hypothetical protein
MFHTLSNFALLLAPNQIKSKTNHECAGQREFDMSSGSKVAEIRQTTLQMDVYCPLEVLEMSYLA